MVIRWQICRKPRLGLPRAQGQANQAKPSAQAKPPELSLLQERRALLRQINQKHQARLEQSQRCIEQAGSLTELDRCGRGTGWGCPMW